MKMKSHDLARKLLEGPNLAVRFQDEESAYSGYVDHVDANTGQFCECDDYPDDEGEDTPEIPWESCVTLAVGSTDGILTGDSIIEA
jgi:hypothetical protein